MKKHRLNLGDLEIDSFEVLPEAQERGTVHAHDPTEAECQTYGTACCAETDGGTNCGIGSQTCLTYGHDCTWYPVLICQSNPIAYPTDPRCDRQNCGVELTTEC